MLSQSERLINEVNRSSQRWKRQGHQRRSSVTDLHGLEYTAVMDETVPAQFYTSISYDFDRFAHWWLKIIINPYSVKSISEGGGADISSEGGFTGDGTYTGTSIKYGGYEITAEQIDALTTAAKEYGVLPSGVIVQLYLESMWGNSNVGRVDNNWGGMTWGGSGDRPSGVKVTQGSSRPANEGGSYIHYNTVGDFFKDYMYLLARSTAGNNQKMYAVQGKTTLAEYTKGLFRAGGAMYDYAAVGYEAYLPTMQSIYDGINKANGDILKKIDDQVLNGTPKNQAIDEEGGGSEATFSAQETASTEKTQSALKQIEARQGQTVGNGECYGLAALYSQILGGPGLGGGVTGLTDVIGDTMSAGNIGTGYDWAKHGWNVMKPTKIEDLKAGAMVTLRPGTPQSPGPYGHVSVVKSLADGKLTVIQQNARGRFVTVDTYDANTYLSYLNHVIYPPELVAGGTVKGSNSTGGTSTSSLVEFPDDIQIFIDGIDFTPMFKAQFGGQWIDKYAVFPNDKPNEGYDVMYAAAGLTDEERAKIYTSGEHLVEVSGSMQADVILRTYLKYNHLN